MDLSPRILEGRHVRLEPLASGHLDDLSAVGLDEELWRWTTSFIRTPKEMREYVEAALTEARAGRALPFATVERGTGRAVGTTRFANADGPHRRVEIGWTWLGRAWQRTALNTEAKYLMLRHAFEEAGMHRVEFKTDVLNERSRRALLRIGAREEGVLRGHMQTAGGRVRDSVYYSILAPEWPVVKARLEERLARGDGRAPEPRHAGGDTLRSDSGSRETPAPRSSGGTRRGRRGLPGGFELDDDPTRIDLAEVHRYLSTQSYWAKGRPRERVDRLVREASRVVGLYRGERQVGFARTVSDGQSFAYLADVYVLPEFRGRGLGVELVREAVDNSPFADRRWLLHTADAHDLYRKIGFGAPGERLMERGAPGERRTERDDSADGHEGGAP